MCPARAAGVRDLPAPAATAIRTGEVAVVHGRAGVRRRSRPDTA
jgi:hypothetical protein